MVAKLLNDNKPKTSLKIRIRTVSNFIDLIQFDLICQMFTIFWSGVESKRTVSGGKRKKKILHCVHQLHKACA